MPQKRLLLYLIIFSLILLYFIYYLNTDTKELNQTLDLFLRAIFVLSLVVYLFSEDNLVSIIKPFIVIILVISCLTIISWISSNFHLLPFQSTNMKGYRVGYNFPLGMVHMRKGTFYRPSLYFAEPSYLGFFLGFSYFYISQAIWLKRRKYFCLVVFISGVLTGSFTFYFAFIITFFTKLLNDNVLVNYKEKLSLVYFIAFLLISINLLIKVQDFNNVLFSNFQTSLEIRKLRIHQSILTIREETAPEILMGLGPGYIEKTRALGESNAFVKLLIEEGLIVTILILTMIYSNLKNNTPLMLFCLIAFNSVVILDTPFVIFLLLISSIFNKLKEEPRKFNSILRFD
jgi:hypothetical protein